MFTEKPARTHAQQVCGGAQVLLRLGKYQLLLHIGHSFHLKRLYFYFSLTSFSLFIFTSFYLLWESVCSSMCVHEDAHGPLQACGGHRAVCREWLSPSTMRVLGMKLGLQARQPVPSPSGSPLFRNACFLFFLSCGGRPFPTGVLHLWLPPRCPESKALYPGLMLTFSIHAPSV